VDADLHYHASPSEGGWDESKSSEDQHPRPTAPEATKIPHAKGRGGGSKSTGRILNGMKHKSTGALGRASLSTSRYKTPSDTAVAIVRNRSKSTFIHAKRS